MYDFVRFLKIVFALVAANSIYHMNQPMSEQNLHISFQSPSSSTVWLVLVQFQQKIRNNDFIDRVQNTGKAEMRAIL